MLYKEIFAVCPEIHTKHINTLCRQSVELLRAIISFVMSVRPSARPQGTTWLPRDRFSWNWILEYFSKICLKKIQVSLKSDKNNRYF